MILKCEKCRTSFFFDDNKTGAVSIKVRCSVCKTIYNFDLPLNSAKEKKVRDFATPVMENIPYSEDYDYYTKTEDEILGHRKYFEFRDASMFQSSKRVRSIGNDNQSVVLDQIPDDIQKNEIPVLKKKAEQDFKSRKISYDSDIDEFLSDDSFYPIPDAQDGDDIFLFDGSLSEESRLDKEPSSIGSEPYEWFVDDLDPFQEELYSESLWEVETHGKVTEEQRAYQIAESTCESVHWAGKDKIDLLAKIFIENGWSLNRTRLLREINAGMTYEMVALATKIRSLWNKHDEFKAGYYKKWVADVHTNVEWRFCHALILSYNSLPNEEEIEFYLLELFDGWYCSNLLQKMFLTFYDYINYRITSGLPFDMIPDIPFEENPNESFLYYTGLNHSFLEFK